MIKNLIKQLDQPLPDSKEEPRVYPVHYARASDLALILNDLFEQDQNQFGGDFFFGGSETTSLTGLSGKVKIIPDPMTNSLIVIAATPCAFGVIEKLLKKLDRMAPEFGGTRVYPLKNADAEHLATQLNALFEESQGQNNRGGGFFWFQN